MADFSDILQEAEKLTTDIEGPSELPRVERSLHQVLEASKELYSRVTQTGTKDIQANLLLGSKGVDLPKIAQKLETISTKRTFEPVESADVKDIAAYMANHIKNLIYNTIEEEQQKSLDAIGKQSWEHLLGEWKQEKRKLLNAMLAPSGGFVEMVKPQSVFIESPSLSSTNMDYYDSIYAKKVIEYNKAAGRTLQKINLVDIFSKAAEEFKDSKVNDMWEMLKYMVQFPSIPIEEDVIKVRNSTPGISALVKQGKRYLEDRYKIYMTNVINENLTQAVRGGVPGTYHLVRSFVGVRLVGDYLGLQDGTLDGRPLWPMVYYCLRSGDISAALHCVKNSGCADCSDIVALLEAKFETPESVEILKLEANVRFQYKRFVRNSTDPFKRIVWAVLGCCDVYDEHTEVAKTVDDYLWLKLSLVRVNYEVKEDHVVYGDLQKTVLEDYGETHYDALVQPHLYFQVLTLTGQFESALEFLFRIERYKLHAVHMAIALNEMYLLAKPTDVTSPIICVDAMDPKPSRRLNVARMILVFVQRFEVTCPAEAMQYFYLLRHVEDVDGASMFLKCVADLVVETRFFEEILGKVQKNGIRARGLVDGFQGASVTAEEIAAVAARKMVDKGMFLEAIELFDIANDQEQVLSLYCTMLSQVVELPNQPGSIRERIGGRINEIAERYGKEGFKCSSRVLLSFTMLRDMMQFFDCYHAKEYNLAFEVLKEMRLVALDAEELEERVSNFKRFNYEVSKIMPSILLATMNMLFDQYQKLKSSELIPTAHAETGADKQLKFVQNQAKVLTNFAGMLPYKMPGDTNSRLIQMEILMH